MGLLNQTTPRGYSGHNHCGHNHTRRDARPGHARRHHHNHAHHAHHHNHHHRCVQITQKQTKQITRQIQHVQTCHSKTCGYEPIISQENQKMLTKPENTKPEQTKIDLIDEGVEVTSVSSTSGETYGEDTLEKTKKNSNTEEVAVDIEAVEVTNIDEITVE